MEMGDVLSGEFENNAKCEHRICPDKCTWTNHKPILKAEKENKTV